jgi:hypothetical protein
VGCAICDTQRGAAKALMGDRTSPTLRPMRPYVIQQGDHLRKLAFRIGFDPDSVWNDPSNAQLREKRTPNLLYPGDVLYVPDADEVGAMALDVGTRNPYQASVPRVRNRLVFSNSDGPMAEEPYAIRGLDAPAGATAMDGSITLSVPVTLREFHIHFKRRNVIRAVRVGDMDPINEDSGVDKRLQHLGFLSPPPYWDITVQRATALRLFQAAVGVSQTGIFDATTQKALVERHGS